MTSARISWYSCCFLNFNSCLDPTGQSSCWAVEFWIGLPHQLQHPTATPPRHQRVLWVAKPQIRSPKGGRFIRWFWLYQYVYIYPQISPPWLLYAPPISGKSCDNFAQVYSDIRRLLLVIAYNQHISHLSYPNWPHGIIIIITMFHHLFYVTLQVFSGHAVGVKETKKR